MANVLGELANLMEGRAMTLAERAVEDQASWLKRLGTPPTTATARRRWLHEVRTVAAYRDRYKVEGRRTLGAPQNEAQKHDAARAEHPQIELQLLGTRCARPPTFSNVSVRTCS